LPILVSPHILEYNTERFDQAGLLYPDNGWTISEFVDALYMLRDSSGQTPFVLDDYSESGHLFMLIAAFGGLPVDSTSGELELNLTDPTNVEAIRQVLDLAKEGLIAYSPLSNFSAVSSSAGGNSGDAPAVQTHFLSEVWQLGDPTIIFGEQGENPYRYTTYPYGSAYVPVSFSVKGAYISNQAANPEACYRWISAVSKRPDLFSAMPARRSLINDPAIVQGSDTVALYNQVDVLLQDPNTMSIPALFAGGGSVTGFLLPHWLYEAFDAYVLNNGDLDTSLKDAQGYAKAFSDCTASIPPFDPSTQNMRDYNRQYADCALKADPRLKSLFGQ
jgi:ABC-type glycerol-3-phosphate transport system substrate-binding protein